MTLREKVEAEIFSSKRRLEDIRKEIDSTIRDVQRSVEADAYGMAPGLAMNHAALNTAIYGTRFRETQERISMLEWLLNEDEPA